MSADEFKEKLVESLALYTIPIKHYYLIGPNDIKIKLTDDVVMNLKNESVYTCSLDKGIQSFLIIFTTTDPFIF